MKNNNHQIQQLIRRGRIRHTPLFVSIPQKWIVLCLILFFSSTAYALTCPAIGGNITEDGSFCIHTFYTNGTFNNTATGVTNISLLVVGGGGGAGSKTAGGGGAGGVVYNGSFTISASVYTVTVGQGGLGGAADNRYRGSNGTVSQFNSSISSGGGGGGSAGTCGSTGSGYSGASGGGNGGECAQVPLNPGLQGSLGGNGYSTSNYGGGGGGGAGAAGQNGTVSKGGDGGYGFNTSISGNLTCYAGGGAGGIYVNSGHGIAVCGGGNTSLGGTCSQGGNATENTGSGGGSSGMSSGCDSNPSGRGGKGGSGIVIVRYLAASEIVSLTPVFWNKNWTAKYAASDLSDFIDFNIAANYSNQSGAKIAGVCNWTGYNISRHVEKDLYGNFTMNTTAHNLTITMSASTANVINDRFYFTVCKTNPSVYLEVLVNSTIFRTLDAVIPDCSAGVHNEMNISTVNSNKTSINLTLRCNGCGPVKSLRFTPDYDGGIVHYERYYLNTTNSLTYNSSSQFYENRTLQQFRQPVQPLNITFMCDNTTNAYSQNIIQGNVSVKPKSVNNVSFVQGFLVEMNTTYDILYDAAGGLITVFNVNLTYQNGTVIRQFNALGNETISFNKSVLPSNGVYNLSAYALSDVGVIGLNNSWFILNDTIDPYIQFTSVQPVYYIGSGYTITGRCDDVNLFSTQMLIYDVTGLRYNLSYINVTGTSQILTQGVYFNVSGAGYVNLSCLDYHTAKTIEPFKDIKTSAGAINISFESKDKYSIDTDDVIIKDMTTDGGAIVLTKTEDRYNFLFNYKNAKSKFSYVVECPGVQLIKRSKYNANFVCPTIEQGKWIDFVADDIASTKISDCGIDCYRVDITTKNPKTAMQYNSIGNMNYAEIIYRFDVTEPPSTPSGGILDIGTCPSSYIGTFNMWMIVVVGIVLIFISGLNRLGVGFLMPIGATMVLVASGLFIACNVFIGGLMLLLGIVSLLASIGHKWR